MPTNVGIKAKIRAAKTKSDLMDILGNFLDKHPYSYEGIEEIYLDLLHDYEDGTRTITFKEAKQRALRGL